MSTTTWRRPSSGARQRSGSSSHRRKGKEKSTSVGHLKSLKSSGMELAGSFVSLSQWRLLACGHISLDAWWTRMGR
jgi:hypothetical protein